MIKDLLPLLILLLVVIAVWVGASVYVKSSEIDIDPNAKAYVQSISSSFDTKGYDDLLIRAKDSLKISPDSFTVLNKTETGN